MENKYQELSRMENLPPRIVIKFHDYLDIPSYGEAEDITGYLSQKNILPWKQLSEKFPGIKIKRSFTSVEPAKVSAIIRRAKKNNPRYLPPNFFCYCTIDCDYGNHDNNEEELLSMLLKNESVEHAYFESDPVATPGVITGENVETRRQGYLDPAPTGINARYAWTKEGGLGENVKFIDIEQGWHLNHEDFKSKHINLLWGQNKNFFQHGNSVLGVILMQDNDVGGIGIAPSVKANVVSQISETGHHTIHNAIMKAIDELRKGDVLLIEAQVKHKNTGNKLWPPEIKPIIFHSIELAVACGIVVIEPAGNGEDKEDAEGNDLDLTSIWHGKNIFNPEGENFHDSGAIMVAAASNSPEHGKIQSSNFGSRIDCFAWGQGVFTTAKPAKSDDLYDPDFKDTSAASAIIAGAAISVQSINIGKGKAPLSPGELREILRNEANGTPSRNRIGVMPDLKKVIDNAI